MHIFWKYITNSSLKMPCVGIFVKHTLYSLYCKPEHREDNSYNIPLGKNRFSYKLTFWFISIENGGKQKVKIPLERKSISFVMVKAITSEVLMPSTKYEGLSYPTHIFKSRGSVIRNNFLDYRNKQATFLCDEMIFMHCLLQIKQNLYPQCVCLSPVVTQFIVKG